MSRDIVFDPIPGGEETTNLPPSSGFGVLLIAGFGFSQTLAELGAAGFGVLALEQDFSQGAEPAMPTFGVGFGVLPLSAIYSFGMGTMPAADGDGVLPLSGTGYATANNGFGILDLLGYGLSLNEGDFAEPPLLFEQSVYVEEGVYFGVAHSTMPTYRLIEYASLGGAPSSAANVKGRVIECMTFSEALGVVYAMLVEEGIVFGPSARSERRDIARAVERLLIQGDASSYADAVAIVIAGMAFGTMVEALATASAEETVRLAPDASSTYTAIESLVEAALFAGNESTSHTGVVLVTDSMLLNADLTDTAELHSLITEGIGFAVNVSIDNGEYIAWVLNTESRGLTRYTQYPFNSFAKIGGRYYGATSAGISRLEGNTDDGTPINAKLRMGLTSMGTRVLKRIPEAFIGYASDGTLLMQVVTVEEATGEKQAAIYALAPRGAVNVRESRFKLGRGMKSVDWDFELQNVNGADFALESIEFRPIRLDRRTRG